jgi:hypothetical protein
MRSTKLHGALLGWLFLAFFVSFAAPQDAGAQQTWGEDWDGDGIDDGNFLIGASGAPNLAGENYPRAMKISPTGDLIFEHLHIGGTSAVASGTSIRETLTGGYVIAGVEITSRSGILLIHFEEESRAFLRSHVSADVQSNIFEQRSSVVQLDDEDEDEDNIIEAGGRAKESHRASCAAKRTRIHAST